MEGAPQSGKFGKVNQRSSTTFSPLHETPRHHQNGHGKRHPANWRARDEKIARQCTPDAPSRGTAPLRRRPETRELIFSPSPRNSEAPPSSSTGPRSPARWAFAARRSPPCRPSRSATRTPAARSPSCRSRPRRSTSRTTARRSRTRPSSRRSRSASRPSSPSPTMSAASSRPSRPSRSRPSRTPRPPSRPSTWSSRTWPPR